MSIFEARCHVCGAMLDGHIMEYDMDVTRNPYKETCSEKCYEVYYTDPDGAQEREERDNG